MCELLTRQDLMYMRAKAHIEAIKLVNDYLNETLGSSFVNKHFEVLGIEENAFIPSTWFVIYIIEMAAKDVLSWLMLHNLLTFLYHQSLSQKEHT